MVDVLILASGSQQQKALLELFSSYDLSNIDENFFEASVTLQNMPLNIRVVVGPIAGNVYHIVQQASAKFNPKTILLVGPAESVKEGVNVGDIVIASQIIETSEGAQRGSHTFWPLFNSSSELIEKAQYSMGERWYGPLPNIYSKSDTPKILISPTLLLDRVINVTELDAIVRQHRKIIAVDMESAGLVQATKHISAKARSLVIRGISGRFGGTKDDPNNIDYACDVAAAFCLEFVRRACKPSFATNGGGVDDSGRNENYQVEEDVRSAPHADLSSHEAATENGSKSQRYEYAGKKHFQFFSEVESRQLCLGISDYAQAIAHVLDQAKGEVCLSIMGHWGRGKTFLMTSVEKELQKSDLSHCYRTIWFSAWKYRTFPEIWVHLYQAFAEASLKDGVFSSIPRTFRTNIKKATIWPIFAGIICLNFIILPFFDKVLLALGILAILVSVLGVLGLLKIIVTSRGIAKTAKNLTEKYLHLTNHEEKLGLQASIAKDIKYLITGWFDNSSLGIGHLFIYGVLVVTTGILMHVALSGERVLFYGVPLRPSAFIVNIITGLWGVVAVIGPIWLLCGGKKENRLLLIVDDLDRCPPGQILDIIESIKLLLEDKDISKYVQIAMLVEYEMLKEAILSKYKISNIEYTPERIIEDNIYKLFLATLTLPPLTSKEIAEVSDAYIVVPNALSSENQRSSMNDNQDAEPSPYDSAAIDSSTSSEAPDDVPRSEPHLLKHVLAPSSHLDVVEQRAIMTAVNDRTLWGQRRSVTPRAIQSLLLRYQLARYLLMLQGATYDPYQLSRLLIANGVKNNETIESSQDDHNVDEAIQAVVSRLSI